MTPNKTQITTDAEIMEAYGQAFFEVKRYSPTWVNGDKVVFARIFRKMMENYELVHYRVEDSLGVVVEVTETNGTTSRFVNVAKDKWYCDGRPTGTRFLKTRVIQYMNPRPA